MQDLTSPAGDLDPIERASSTPRWSTR